MPLCRGASLIAEIKKSFPEKVVIAYTGAALNERAARVATARADTILKKDIDIEEWTTNLDKMAAEATDPYIIWNKIRARFVELNVKTREIIILEDAYVRSVLKGGPSFNLLTSRAEDSGVQQDARAILQGLASSLIFQAIFPGSATG
jgi:hypothetical protein